MLPQPPHITETTKHCERRWIIREESRFRVREVVLPEFNFVIDKCTVHVLFPCARKPNSVSCLSGIFHSMPVYVKRTFQIISIRWGVSREMLRDTATSEIMFLIKRLLKSFDPGVLMIFVRRSDILADLPDFVRTSDAAPPFPVEISIWSRHVVNVENTSSTLLRHSG